MVVFRKFKGLHINCGHRDPDPQKAHPWSERRRWRLLRKNSFRCVGCSLIEEPKKTNKKVYSHPMGTAKSRNLGSRNL